jgi:hypothetical protein
LRRRLGVKSWTSPYIEDLNVCRSGNALKSSNYVGVRSLEILLDKCLIYAHTDDPFLGDQQLLVKLVRHQYALAVSASNSQTSLHHGFSNVNEFVDLGISLRILVKNFTKDRNWIAMDTERNGFERLSLLEHESIFADFVGDLGQNLYLLGLNRFLKSIGKRLETMITSQNLNGTKLV